jgi:hypothetical protein
MIFTMVKDLHDRLHRRKYPVVFSYGPERLGRTAPASMHIVFSRDTVDGDKCTGIIGALRNPRKQDVRTLGVVAILSVQFPRAGAMQHEHEHLCDTLVDAVIVEIGDWCVSSQAGQPEWVETRYLSDEEVSGAELGAGVHYIIRFRIARGVYALDFDGSILDEGIISKVISGAEVTVNGQQEEVI